MTGALLPRPRRVTAGQRRDLTNTPNRVAGDCSPRLARAVDRLPPMGLTLRFVIDAEPTAVPALADRYGYRLEFGEVARVEAATEWGALAALATLAQLGAGGALAVAEIHDAPRYPWRGLMIDVARHFISLATLERTLDAMWFYKLNVLHLHLTDDQGFRFRSRGFPELASPAAYSGPELARLVAYAADRGIRVVPELDVPGHSTSWLLAHPEWGVGGGAAVAPSHRFGVHPGCLDAANGEALAAVGALFRELAEVFPDEFLHFGGDEVSAAEGAIPGAFQSQVAATLASLGRRGIGWDECLAARLPATTVIQAWRSGAARDAALAAGFDCVVSAPYYLDLGYPAEIHYAFDPAADFAAAEAAMLNDPRLAHVRSALPWPAELAPAEFTPAEFAPAEFAGAVEPATGPRRRQGQVLGGEACMWTELVTDALLDTRLWSRLPAIAERFWSDPGAGDRLYQRLVASRRRLAEMGGVAEHAGIDEYPDLAPLIEMLEPVKGYLRLLGEAEFRRRAEGAGGPAGPRPYDATTALDRIVDRLPPESLAGRRAAADLAAGAPMEAWLDGWRRQRAALARHPELEAELGAAATALAALAEIVAGESDADPGKLAGPFGEYLLPIAYAVRQHR